MTTPIVIEIRRNGNLVSRPMGNQARPPAPTGPGAPATASAPRT
jgi:hypothetical protein